MVNKMTGRICQETSLKYLGNNDLWKLLSVKEESLNGVFCRLGIWENGGHAKFNKMNKIRQTN